MVSNTPLVKLRESNKNVTLWQVLRSDCFVFSCCPGHGSRWKQWRNHQAGCHHQGWSGEVHPGGRPDTQILWGMNSDLLTMVEYLQFDFDCILCYFNITLYHHYVRQLCKGIFARIWYYCINAIMTLIDRECDLYIICKCMLKLVITFLIIH